MAGRGPAPKVDRNRRADPTRGEWTPSPEGGWQHPLPPPPAGLLPSSVAVWETWFKAWWAANWGPDDLPALRLLIRLWDRVHRGDVKRMGELRQLMDSYGVTPKGQQDRRWVRPVAKASGHKPPGYWEQRRSGRSGRFDHLRVTADPESMKQRLGAIEAEEQRRMKGQFRDLTQRPRDPRLPVDDD